MQVVVDADYLDLMLGEDNKSKSGVVINPFTGKKVQTVSMDSIKKLLSLPKEERKKLLLGLSNNSSYT